MKNFLERAGLLIIFAIFFIQARPVTSDSHSIVIRPIDEFQPPTLKQTEQAYRKFVSRPANSLKDINTFDDRISIRYPEYGTVLIMPRALYDAQQKYFADYAKKHSTPPIPLM